MSRWTGSPAGSRWRARARCGDARRRGFTLIEILVALAILTLALTGLFQAFSGGLRSARVTSDYTTATALAESKLADLGAEASLTPGRREGRFEDGFRWTADVRPYGEEDRDSREGRIDLVDAYRVTVSVSWGKPDDERSVSLSTLRLAPAAAR